ncbi:protein mono-ADP-ribosyltransferase PARP6-like [Ptychodera flava]|uniref:protein mono-ADP-ribosyltransferase PARP6-like n=1 Tax=Ptychodera flava TaxID=63121 RepID=UPI00396A260E
MSHRHKKMQADIKCVEDACNGDPTCPFTDFEHGENTFSFTCTKKDNKVVFTFHMSDDYPDHTMLSSSDNPHNPEVKNERIPLIFAEIAADLWKKMDLKLPTTIMNDDSMESKDENRPDFVTMESVESHYSDCVEDVDDLDDEEDFEIEAYATEEDEDIHTNPVLAQDLDQVRLRFGDDAVNTRTFGAIDDIDVELNLDVSFLDEEIATAWKVNRHEPVVVRLHCSLSRYLDATEPKVEVFQPSNKEKFGLGAQLRKILEQFLSDHWKELSNDSVQTKHNALNGGLNFETTHSSSPPCKKLNTGQPQFSHSVSVDDGMIHKVTDMGFSAEVAHKALIVTRSNIDEAVNLLLNQPESIIDVQIPQDSAMNKRNKSKLFSRQRSVPTSSTSAMFVDPNFGVNDEIHLLPSLTQNGKNAKNIPTLEYGFLVQAMLYVRNRIPTLNEYCVVCDEPHVFQNGAMLKPAVCARELCVFAFQNLGVMQDAADDIATGAEVVDLLVAMANAAVRSARKELIFDPYPMIVDPQNPREFAFNPKKKNFNRATKALDNFISVREMMQISSSTEMKKRMDKEDPLAYPLFQWIISSNRSHIVKLPESRQIRFMHTAHQFLLCSSPPAKEAAFRTHKKELGSVFAFHGSHIENWHSIMRHGLINASGTKHQMHGSAYGKGIYLSPNASVSFGYSGMGHGYHRPIGGKTQSSSAPSKSKQKSSRFLQSKNLTCIALCEVINSKDLRKNGNIWVCPNQDHVCTRFFFVYEDGQVGDSSVDTTVERFQREILKAIGNQTYDS